MSSSETLIPEGTAVAALAIHDPRPEHSDDWVEVMRQVASASGERPGFLGIAGFRDLHSNRLVAISYWESEDALNQMLPAAVKGATELDERWGATPTDVLVLRPL